MTCLFSKCCVFYLYFSFLRCGMPSDQELQEKKNLDLFQSDEDLNRISKQFESGKRVTTAGADFNCFPICPTKQQTNQKTSPQCLQVAQSAFIYSENERANIHMGGFPTNQPLTLRRQNLSFLVNMQETDQACGLKGAEEQHCRRTSYLTVRCKMLICFAASETEQLDEFDLISKTFSFFFNKSFLAVFNFIHRY